MVPAGPHAEHHDARARKTYGATFRKTPLQMHFSLLLLTKVVGGMGMRHFLPHCSCHRLQIDGHPPSAIQIRTANLKEYEALSALQGCDGVI